MEFLFGETDSEQKSYKTLFGFETDNKFAANALNIVYAIVMIVSIAFAHYSLGLILVEWNPLIVFLSALAVVGLPYCIKIILYGRKIFTSQMAVLCIAVSVLPTIFDFVGFYAKTSVRQSLIETKFGVLEKVNFFDKDARQKLNEALLQLEQEHLQRVAQIDQSSSDKAKEVSKKVLEAEQTYLDETQGVPGRVTSGKPGEGPKAKELESEVRKREAEAKLEQTNINLEKQRELDRAQKEYESKKASLLEGIKAIDDLVSTQDNQGLVFQVSRAKTFDELAEGLIKLNASINTISSRLELKPEYVKFSTENIIQLSFGALFRGEITAIICMTLAILLEIVDTVIVYAIRGQRHDKPKKINAERNVRETIKYS